MRDLSSGVDYPAINRSTASDTTEVIGHGVGSKRLTPVIPLSILIPGFLIMRFQVITSLIATSAVADCRLT
jgi:hypothetical protein